MPDRPSGKQISPLGWTAAHLWRAPNEISARTRPIPACSDADDARLRSVLDEAVALAAGHRPCCECRREFYRAYIDAANVENDTPILGAKDLDKQLNASRRTPRTRASIAALPGGAFIALGDNDFRLVWDGALHRWSPSGYTDAIGISAASTSEATVLTPSLSIAALRHGYPVKVHPSVA